ncbi:DUF4386 domain-containing protein [Mucilaginibacter sp. RS28]|uniref:DUF4386 domain-containing protein n=1 Tax=Mucilaginibacter straminoryzae TaxID=2932774 RepID=A0A9X1X1T5_9SPHI|nr:DUF4386 domain-containing protein [Mucilaginibacter straminoryzae]MCJ8209091.1 DUF4386 domain-containing protein [Mucilaginibacter straminoryzae]
MDTSKRTARLAGILYLIVVFCGTFYLQYIPSKIKLKGAPSAILPRLVNGELLFKVSIVFEIICWLAFAMLPIILYKLFKPVNGTVARLMVVFAVVQVPIAFINLLNKFAVLYLISGSTYLKALPTDHLTAQILFFLNLYRQGNFINQIFWGLWLFPFGYLVYKSGFMPKILGLLLMAGCIGYLIDFFGSFLFPTYDKTIISNYITLPASLGEIGICLWLIIIGIKDKQIPLNTSSAASI